VNTAVEMGELQRCVSCFPLRIRQGGNTGDSHVYIFYQKIKIYKIFYH
jgi:hypothetical protein